MVRVGARVGAIMLALAASTLPLGAQSRTGAFDVTAGQATVRGPRVPTSTVLAVDLTLLQRLGRFGRAGGALGLRTGSGSGDVCFIDPHDANSCLGRVSRHLHVMGLGGLGYGDDSGELRLLAGPLLVLGLGSPGVGGVLAIDGAAGSEQVLLTAEARFTMAYRSTGGRIASGQFSMGVRLRY